MKRTVTRPGNFVIAVAVFSITIFWFVSYYTHNDTDLPAGNLLINDIYAGYKLAIPQYWYEIPAPASPKDVISFFLDAYKFRHVGNVKLPIDLSILKQGSEFRTFFLDFNEQLKQTDFIATGTIIVARESGVDDADLVKSKIKQLNFETGKLLDSYQPDFDNNIAFHAMEGTTNTRAGAAYIRVVYFRTNTGLVIIPIVSALNQSAQIRSTVDEIVKSIEIFEPQKIPNSGK